MYREAFWVAVCAAAPVIALATVVAYTDVHELVMDWASIGADRSLRDELQPGDKFLDDTAMLVLQSAAAWLLCLANLVVQAAALAFSLASLAYARNEWPPWAGIAAGVGGISALAVIAIASAGARRRFRNFQRRSVQQRRAAEKRDSQA